MRLQHRIRLAWHVLTSKELPNRWTRAETMWTFHWNELRDVTPLYPKGQEA